MNVSSQSSNCLITHLRSIHAEFEVHSIPLKIVIMLFINVTMDNWLTNINEKEHWDTWEHDSCVVSTNTYIKDTISF